MAGHFDADPCSVTYFLQDVGEAKPDPQKTSDTAIQKAWI